MTGKIRAFRRNELSEILLEHYYNYPTPSNLSYFWGFGSLALCRLLIQIISGIFLAMYYIPQNSLAFLSVEYIMRNVHHGWLLRYIHTNGASMFSLVTYLHLGRSLYHGSYSTPRWFVWVSGRYIPVLMIITAFLGYIPPRGQMSFRAATVITNLATAIPFVGESLVTILWGDFSVGNATLNRFSSLHYLLPFVIAGLTSLHIILLHSKGSNNPLGNSPSMDTIPFKNYFYVKDLYSFFIFLFIFAYFIFFKPNYLGHPDNHLEANPMVTPIHIVPEWYFSPFHALPRSIPNKLGGMLALIGAIFCLILSPSISPLRVRNVTFRTPYKLLFWSLILDMILSGWLGSQPVEYPYTLIGQIATFIYFALFLAIYLYNLMEKRELIHIHNNALLRKGILGRRYSFAKLREIAIARSKLLHAYLGSNREQRDKERKENFFRSRQKKPLRFLV